MTISQIVEFDAIRKMAVAAEWNVWSHKLQRRIELPSTEEFHCFLRLEFDPKVTSMMLRPGLAARSGEKPVLLGAFLTEHSMHGRQVWRRAASPEVETEKIEYLCRRHGVRLRPWDPSETLLRHQEVQNLVTFLGFLGAPYQVSNATCGLIKACVAEVGKRTVREVYEAVCEGQGIARTEMMTALAACVHAGTLQLDLAKPVSVDTRLELAKA